MRLRQNGIRRAATGGARAALLGGALLWVAPLAAQVPAGTSAAPAADALFQGEFWRDQGLENILLYWTRHARDQEHGAFFSHLDRTWQPVETMHKYPGMVSRHLFSYSTAYLLSGDESYLELAGEVFDYLAEHGWDPEHGLWYDELDRSGEVVGSGKDLFHQAYAVTGLAMYYFVTHDARAREYIDRSIELLEKHAWDGEHGGYVRGLNRDLSISGTRKDFSPQIAHVSGYLMYLYPATRDPRHLQHMERILGVVMDRSRDPETGWVRGRYDRAWNPTEPREEARVNVGHNLETAWLLLRLHLLTGDEAYREAGLRLGDEMLEHGFDPRGGVWLHQVGLADPTLHGETTPWWIQAYGNMMQLYQYRITGEERHLDAFRKGAEFWNRAFIDPEHGAAYLSVFLDGRMHKGDKAVRTKTSYHSMEYALLNYLYLNLWVADRPVELHFRVDDPARTGRLYPSPIEDPSVRIARVEIDGREWTDFDPKAGYITLPETGPVRVKAVLVKP